MNDLQNKIKEYGIKQKYLAKKIGICESYVSLLLSGRVVNKKRLKEIENLVTKMIGV